MKLTNFAAALSLLPGLLYALPARAQDSSAASTGLPTLSPEPTQGNDTAKPAEPNSAAPKPAAPVAPQPGCELGPHAGISEPDAQTAARLICDELLRQNASTTESYRVELMRLGEGLFVSLAIVREGRPAEQRRVRLASIEELPDATPRLVSALLQRKEVEKTQEYGNLLQTETRAPLRKNGALLIGVGVMGQYTNQILAPGFEVSLRYDTRNWVIGSALRYSGGSTDDRKVSVFSWGVGGRYMLMPSDMAPFVGGGLALEIITLKRVRDYGLNYDVFQGDHSGIAVYAEAGVELLRLHKSRLTGALRVDAPLFNIQDSVDSSRTRYYLPTSFTLTYSFN